MYISIKIVFKMAAAVFPATKKPRFQAGLFLNLVLATTYFPTI